MNRKLIFIIPYLTKGGAQRVVANLCNYFAKEQYSVSIIVLNDCEIGYELEKEIEVIHLFNKTRTENFLSRIFYTVSSFVKILYYVLKKSPSHLIAFTTSANMWAGIIGTLTRVPYIVSERTVPSRTLTQFNPLVQKFIHYLYKHASAIVSPSIGIQKELQDIQALKNLTNYHIIKNPVTPFGPVTGQTVHSKSFILAVGRLMDVKGFDLLIRAFDKIKTKDLDLIIVGEGSSREALTNLISELNLTSSVYLPGRKSNIQDYYKQCQVFVLSSRNEGYPNVLIEAMSAGCPSIAFDCHTGPADIIENGVNGLLVDNGNIQMLADAIDFLAVDRPLRERLSSQSKLIGTSNSIHEIAGLWEELILNHHKKCSKRLSY